MHRDGFFAYSCIGLITVLSPLKAWSPDDDIGTSKTFPNDNSVYQLYGIIYYRGSETFVVLLTAQYIILTQTSSSYKNNMTNVQSVNDTIIVSRNAPDNNMSRELILYNILTAIYSTKIYLSNIHLWRDSTFMFTMEQTFWCNSNNNYWRTTKSKNQTATAVRHYEYDKI